MDGVTSGDGHGEDLYFFIVRVFIIYFWSHH